MRSLLVCIAFSGLVLAWLASPAPGAEPCKSTSVGIDTSLATNSGGTLYSTVGQTFHTSDTLLTSFTLWGTGGFTYHSVTPFLMLTDASGVPTSQILWQGPAVANPDAVSPKAFKWTFDPPLVLPAAGTYAWLVCSGILDFLTTGQDRYPEGTAWSTGRGCVPGYFYRVDADFVFTATFCTDAVTPTRRRTWGELKSIYR